MTFLESLLVLLLAAIVLLQVSRRLAFPYPAMLAVAGVVVAFVPGSPTIPIDPDTMLALFIAPVLLDAAYDFPVGAAWQLWRPLVVLALVAVLATTATVAWIGWAVAGLPVAAAVVLGAIVAPPDAAAATAVLGTVSLPRRTIEVLKGESLFNDATALLLFSGALAFQSSGGFHARVGLELALAAPGGILFGIAAAMAMRWVGNFVAGTLGGSVLQFVNVLLVWIVAEHLQLSAVLAVVACAMTIARSPGAGGSPRMRVHSLAVWATVVFLLNVLAFLLMGMQARIIIKQLSVDRLWEAVRVTGLVILAIVVVRFSVVMAWNRLAARYRFLRGDLEPPSVGQGVIVGWSGMRGLVSLATAFALPAQFPQRDLVVLAAFGVVLATLVVQGLTLAPLIRLLKLDRMEDPARELADARSKLAEVALARLDGAEGHHADKLRETYTAEREAAREPQTSQLLKGYRQTGIGVVSAQREALDQMRAELRIGMDAYYVLQEELDWRELTLLPEEKRRIEEA